MMVVVLGDEENEVEHADLLLQTWMKRHLLDELFVVSVEAPDELHSFGAKGGEDIFDSLRIMIRLVRPAIFHVGGMQHLKPRFVIIKAIHSQRLKVEQMPCVLLNRPFIIIPPSQNLPRE